MIPVLFLAIARTHLLNFLENKRRNPEMETGITVKAGNILLEGLFCRGSHEYGVVVTHPHPQYGGDMHNDVVSSLVQAYYDKGFTTLRFNFRGVGGSTGAFENGLGEADDVLGAIQFLVLSGMEQIHLVGYSFGAWVNALVPALPEEVVAVVAISPPVSFLDYSNMAKMPQLKMIVSGQQDDFAGVEDIQNYHNKNHPQATLTLLEGCDHFYSGNLEKLQSIVNGFLK
jgi:uncharacterized protein